MKVMFENLLNPKFQFQGKLFRLSENNSDLAIYETENPLQNPEQLVSWFQHGFLQVSHSHDKLNSHCRRIREILCFETLH